MTSIDQPAFDIGRAEQIAEKHFGIQGRASTLPSDRDHNFRLDATDGKRYALKIANANATEDRLQFENEVTRRAALALHPISTPMLVESLNGKDFVVLAGTNGARFIARLLTWVDGAVLATFRPHTAALFNELGAGLGRLDAALADLEEVGVSSAPEWNLESAGAVVHSGLADIADSAKRVLVEYHLDGFDRRSALWPKLPQQVVHNDANDYNILVGVDDRLQPRIVGLIDFGDAEVGLAAMIGCIGPHRDNETNCLQPESRVGDAEAGSAPASG